MKKGSSAWKKSDKSERYSPQRDRSEVCNRLMIFLCSICRVLYGSKYISEKNNEWKNKKMGSRCLKSIIRRIILIG